MDGKSLVISHREYLDSGTPGKGPGYMRRADHYFAQKAVGGLAQGPTLHTLRPATPENYHSAREPSEFEYESEGSEGSGTDSTGYSSTTTAYTVYIIYWQYKSSCNPILGSPFVSLVAGDLSTPFSQLSHCNPLSWALARHP